MPSRYDKNATHHTSRRTDGWDYTQPAVYFVTLCTRDRACLFGAVNRGRMSLNPFGQIVVEEWRRSEAIRDRVHLDAFVVMPNHLHGIVAFAEPEVEAPTCPWGYQIFGGEEARGELQESPADKASTGRSTLGEESRDRPSGPSPRSLGSFIAGFKSAATKPINEHRETPGSAVWQRNYHDVIIRDERHWRNAREYIRRNPEKWFRDRLHRAPDS